MKTVYRRTSAAILVVFPITLLGVPLVRAQEKSVKPGINKEFEAPDIPKFIERFEKEGREIYEKRQEIIEACKIKPGSVVADVGAGTGLFTRLLSPAVGPKGRVYSVDIAKKFLDHIAKTCEEQGIKNVVPILCTPSSVELKPNSVDVVFICDTYHHFEFPFKTVASIHEALRPGGQVIVVDFVRKEGVSSFWIFNHVRAGQEVFAKEIESCGFRQIEEAKFMKQQYFLRFEKVEAKEQRESGKGANGAHRFDQSRFQVWGLRSTILVTSGRQL